MHETIRSFKNYIKHMHILQHIFEKINCKIQGSLASLGAGSGPASADLIFYGSLRILAAERKKRFFYIVVFRRIKIGGMIL